MQREFKLGADMHERDNILDGLTFDDIITAAHCNLKVITPGEVKRQAKELLEMRLTDFYDLLEINLDEIAQRAR